MPRKTLLRSDLFPYHVTARTNNKEVFPISLEDVWEILLTECTLIRWLFEVEIHALVLMPNHFHFLLTTPNPEYDLGKVMNYFMSDITRAIHAKSGRSGRVFGGPYFWSIVTSTRYYGHVLKYVYRNPVRAGLVDRVEEYEFSTLRGLIGLRHQPFPIHFTRIGGELNTPDSDLRFAWLEWLNEPFVVEMEDVIRESIRKKEIKDFICRKTRRPIFLRENSL